MFDVDAALASLSLSDRCTLLAGATNWRTHGFPEAGVPVVKMSDGPTGVRGEGHGSTGTAGVAVPAGITLGASWDPDLLAEIGDLLGTEARRKGAHVLLGPTINLHRTPLGGRTFECYSEDPDLTAALAARYVAAVQAHDVAVTVKHFVCNDTEIERLRVDVDVDEVTLRELYLRPFERAIIEGGAWGVMTAYNQLAGEYCAHSHRLLTGILRGEWGFDGFVVSDWFGSHDTVGAATAGLSLEMPAPARVYGHHLLEAVERGDVDEATVERLVRDVLVLIRRTKADERSADEPEVAVDDPAERTLTRRAAVAGTVLLRNERVDELGGPVLPLDAAWLGRVAVVGPNAVLDRSMGGGSASLTPFGHRTILEALTDRLRARDPEVEVVYEPGVRIDRLAPIARRERLRTPSGEPGLAVEFVNGTDWDAPATLRTVTTNSQLRFFGSTPEGIDPTSFAVRVAGSYVPAVDGPHDITVVSAGGVRMDVVATDDDGVATRTCVFDDPDATSPRTREYFGYGSAEHSVTVDGVAGRPVELDVRWRSAGRLGFAAIRVGVRPPDPDDLLERAVRAAADADTTLVVVGTNDEWETEGFDREVMELPGGQDELIRRVVAVNPNTAVVVNAGSPVSMDWASAERSRADGSAPAIVTSFFAGQEQAEAMVDVLLGEAEPGGRLPITYPARLADTPAYLHHEPEVDGCGRPTQRYGEGRFVGHRWYAARGIAPRFWFGHGLSYGSSEWGEVEIDGERSPAVQRRTVTGVDADPVVVSVPVLASGDRDVPTVVQVYGEPVVDLDRPAPRRLLGWSTLRVSAGERAVAEVRLDRRAFESWDTASGAWAVRPGRWRLDVAPSADPARVHHSTELTIDLD